MKDLNQPKRSIVAILALVYLICGVYIGCDSPQKSSSKKSPAAADKAPDKAPDKAESKVDTKTNTKTTTGGSNATSAKKDKDEKDGKSSSKSKAKSTDDDDDDDDEDEDSTKTVSLKFSSTTQQEAFCAYTAADMLKAIKNFGDLSTSELKEVSDTKIGKALSLQQMKDLKAISKNIKLADVKSLQSQICKTSKGKNKSDDDDDDDDDDD